MTRSLTVALLAGVASLSAAASAQTTTTTTPTTTTTTTSAPMGTMGMAPAPVAQGALVGATIGGIPNAVWADQNNDGIVDGYVQNGTYTPGTPAGYDATLRRVTTAAPALGTATAAAPGVGVAGGAAVGAPIAGLAGAVWADNNGDGVADGYVYNGQYYAGAPQASAAGAPMVSPAPATPPPAARGERG